MNEAIHRDYSVVVGWTSELSAERMNLRIECVTTPPPHDPAGVHAHVYFLSRQQALQLANYLYQKLGETKPEPRRRGWLARLFG